MRVRTHAHANHSVHTINVFKSSRKAEKLPKLRTLKGSELIDEAQLIDLLASSLSASLPQPVSEALGEKTQGDKGSNQGNERLCWDKEGGKPSTDQRADCCAKALTCHSPQSCKNRLSAGLSAREAGALPPSAVYSPRPAVSCPTPPPLALLSTECEGKIPEAARPEGQRHTHMYL